MLNLVTLALILLSIACSKPEGTGTGNPMQPTDNISSVNHSLTIFSDICFVVSSCHSAITQSECYAGLEPLRGFASKLGIRNRPTWTVADIVNLESNKALSPNEAAVAACVSQLQKLSCDHSDVINSYKPELPNPFVHTTELLDPLCAMIFAH